MTHPALARGGLYAVTNGPHPELVTRAALALDGGARMLQYRDKTRDAPRRLAEATQLQALCLEHDVPLIINDDIALAAAVGAAGVHLGENDAAPAAAHEALGRSAIIGASCYDSIRRARVLAGSGVDYLAFGAFFASPTKPQARRATPALLKQAASLSLPLVAIGGITADNGQMLVNAGARFLAVISAVFDAPDPRHAARQLNNLFSTDLP